VCDSARSLIEVFIVSATSRQGVDANIRACAPQVNRFPGAFKEFLMNRDLRVPQILYEIYIVRELLIKSSLNYRLFNLIVPENSA
jgi:hypothetical protein